MPKLIQFTPATITKASERRKTGPSEVVVFKAPIVDVVIESVRDQIVTAWDRGVLPPDIAKRFGVRRIVVDRIIHARRNQYGIRRAA
jgi:hypothetical protein